MRHIDDLTEQEQRLIAADFAERVLPLFEAQYPDDRPRNAIEAARAYARGEITKEQLSAAWAAARAVTGAAARNAAWAFAGAAARDAAWAAASAAAEAAARAAAGAAAWASASAAARAAAGDAAGGAARATAGAAAWDAERAWQQQRIDEVVAARAQP